MVFAFSFTCGSHFHQRGLSHWSLQDNNHSEFTFGRHMCNLVMVCGRCQEYTEWLLPPLLLVGGGFCYSFSCPSATLSIWWGIQLWELAESHLIPPPFLYGRKGSSFQGSVPPNDMVNSKSVMHVKPSDCGCGEWVSGI